MCLVAGCVVARLLDVHERTSSCTAIGANVASAAQAAEPDRQATLDQLCQGQLKLLDLTWPLSRESAYWPGPKYKPFELETLATLDKDGVLSKAYCTPEHLGTHLDAPNHFEARGVSVDQLRPEQFFAPGVVIDVSGPASLDADYRLRLEDVQQWEAAHGRIPRGAVVLLHTGWGRHWNHKERYQGSDVMGRLHFPGFSAAPVRFLLAERDIRGIGIDTLSVDYGLSRDFEVHHLIGAAGRYGLENVAHLDELPARGFYLVVAPIKIETGSGGQARIFAIVP
jgi:kynurenine formamidase